MKLGALDATAETVTAGRFGVSFCSSLVLGDIDNSAITRIISDCSIREY